MGLADADTAETNPGSAHCVITPLSCALPNRREGGPKASGDEPIKIAPGALLHKICGSEDHSEQYFCNYGVNPEFEQQFVAAGLKVSARGGQGEIRAVELPGHRFFIATLFQPQLSSRPESPHPIWVAFLREAIKFRKERARKGRRNAAKTGRRLGR
jgi:CTP synthase (UTP-ammonia lyase)